MNKKIKNQKLFSKLNEQQKVYYKMDLVISDFELRTTELIHEICDKMESIIKDKTSYRERVTQKQIDEGFKFYKQLVKMTGYEKGFHRGEAVTPFMSLPGRY